jgi:hypothetical protein
MAATEEAMAVASEAEMGRGGKGGGRREPSRGNGQWPVADACAVVDITARVAATSSSRDFRGG